MSAKRVKMDYGSISGGTSSECVWENPNPLSAFLAQKVSVDLSKYEAVLVETLTDKSNDLQPRNVVYVEKGSLTTSYTTSGRTVGSSNPVGGRIIKKVDDTGIEFGNAKFQTTDSTDGTSCIPTRIFGLTKKLI